MIIRDLKFEDVESVKLIFSLHWNDIGFRERLVERVNQFLNNAPEIIDSRLHYFVAEINSDIAGIVGFRKAPEHMMEYAATGSPAEIYILAVKEKGEGVGKALVEKTFETIKSQVYTEIVLFSGEDHKESWGFYDHLGFERVAAAKAANGEPGYIWKVAI